MKQLQNTHPDDKKPGQDEEKIGLDDRLGAAGAALVFGLPTAFITWVLALSAELAIRSWLPAFHVSLPIRHWVLGVWAILVVCGFLFPRSMDEIFGALWERLVLGFQIMIAWFN